MTLSTPVKPGNLTFIPSVDSISVHWSYTTPFNRFEVSYGREDQFPTLIGTRYATQRTYRIAGLQPETRYFIEVRAENDNGQSDPQTGKATTNAGTVKPAAPTGISARATKDSVALTWLKSDNATGYRVSYGLHPDGAIIDTQSTLSENCTLGGLRSGTAYYFDLVAYNAAGDSPSVRTTSTTLTAPAAPTNLRATPAILSLDLAWSPSAGAIDYVIRYGIEPGGSAQTVSTTLTNIQLDGLNKNTLYLIEVYARNNNGESSPARITQKTEDGPPVPGRPGPVTAIVYYDAVEVLWSASAQPYEIIYGFMDKYPEIVGRRTTEHLRTRFENLAFDSQYFIEVRAFNASGHSEPRSAQITTGPDRTHPRNLRNPGRTWSEVWLKWEQPIDTTYLIDYEITCPGLESVRTHALEHIFTGLEPEKEYLFSVQPRRPEGPVPASPASISVVTHDRAPPTRPGALKLTPSTPGNATLSWRAAEDMVGVTGYEVRRNGGAWSPVSGTSHTVSSLLNNLPEIFEVRARDAAGNISIAASLTSSMDSTKPTTPGIPVASNITDTSAMLTWAASNDNVAVTSYQLSLNAAAPIIIAGTHHNCTGLTETSLYTVEIRAKDAAGNYSPPSSATFKTLLNTPQDLNFTQVGGIGKLTWKAVADKTITYKVYVNDADISADQYGFSVSFRLSAVPPGPLYRIKIRAERGADYSADAVLDATVEDWSRPDNPGFPVASDITRSSAVMTWTPSDSAQPLEGYRVSINGLFLGLVSGTRYPLNYLIGGVLHLFTVRAQDISGNLSDGVVGGFRTLGDPPVAPPGKPENLRVTARTPESVTLAWTTGPGEGTALGYRITCDDETLGGIAFRTESTITGLIPGLGYTFQVRGYDLFQQVSDSADVHCPASI